MLKHLLKKQLGLQYCYSAGEIKLAMHVDADWAGCKEIRRLTSGHVIFLNGTAISFYSKKQHTVATSSTKAEYIVIGAKAREAV